MSRKQAREASLMCVAFLSFYREQALTLCIFFILTMFTGQKKNTTQWHCVTFRSSFACAMQTRGIKRKMIDDAEDGGNDESDEDYTCPDSSSEESDSGSENPTESEGDPDEEEEDEEEDMDEEDEDDDDEQDDEEEDDEDENSEEDEEQDITAAEHEPVNEGALGGSIF